MSTDNRTLLNDCQANTGWTGSDSASVETDTGLFFESTASLSMQYSNVDENMSTTEQTGVGTFSIDMSDVTLYMLIKDNLSQDYASGGVQFIIGDVTPDTIGYDIGGIDARGVPLRRGFFSFRLDVSVIVTTPGTFQVIAGAEANLDQTAITHVGYGGIHASKAQGAIDNAWVDAIRYMANDSYALTVNGGTAASPLGMSDLVTADESGGWGMVGNPLGTLYYFGAPTQWGNPTTVAEHAFTADGEQWFWLGDNGGGHALGATHFPFRLVSNTTDTGSWIVSNTSIVNTGTRAQFLMDDANFNTIEMDGCALTSLGTIGLPSSGGTSRFTTNNIFTDCDAITNNGADMTGSSVLLSNVALDTGALIYNETVDTDGILDNMTFSQGTADHHAIAFGTAVTSDITLRGIEFTGFTETSGEDANGAALQFLATGGALICSLVGCTVGGAAATASNLFKDDAAGINVTLSFDTVSAIITIKDSNGVAIPGAQVSIFQDDATQTIVQASTATNDSGQTTTGGIASGLGAIIIRVRQSANTLSFRTQENASDGITAASDIINTPVNHHFHVGDAVVYSKQGGTATTGLTDGTTYYTSDASPADANSVKLYTSAALAIADGTPIDLTADAADETHTLNPVRYINNSTVGSIGTSNFTATITMTTDETAVDT